MRTSGEVFFNGRVSHDRACDKLREEGNVRREMDEVALNLRLTAIHVDRVAERLESIEANTDRERDAKKPDARAEDGVHVTDKEVGILEESEHGNARYDRGPHKDLRPLRSLESSDKEAVDVARERGCDHKEGVDRLSVEVEGERCYKEHEILRFSRHKEVHEKHCREEIIYKANT